MFNLAWPPEKKGRNKQTNKQFEYFHIQLKLFRTIASVWTVDDGRSYISFVHLYFFLTYLRQSGNCFHFHFIQLSFLSHSLFFKLYMDPLHLKKRQLNPHYNLNLFDLFTISFSLVLARAPAHLFRLCVYVCVAVSQQHSLT